MAAQTGITIERIAAVKRDDHEIATHMNLALSAALRLRVDSNYPSSAL